MILSRHELKIINRRTCPLRHPSQRGALTPPTALFRRRDEPIGQNAATLSTERSDHHIDSRVLS